MPQDMEASEIGALLRHPAAGATVRGCLDSFPQLRLEAQLQPITRRVQFQAALLTANRADA